MMPSGWEPGSTVMVRVPSKVSSAKSVPRAAQASVQVIAATLQYLVGDLVDLDIEVAGRSPGGPGLAVTREANAGAGFDPGGDLDLDGALGADPAVPGALGAGMRDDGAVSLTGGAR